MAIGTNPPYIEFSDINKLVPTFSRYTNSVAYTISSGNTTNGIDSGTITIDTNPSASSGLSPIFCLASFTTNNANVIPRDLGGNCTLTNFNSGAISTTLTTERIGYKFPVGSLNTHLGANNFLKQYDIIHAEQLNGIGITFTTYSLTQQTSPTMGGNGSASIQFTGGMIPSGYKAMGALAGWGTGNQYLTPYGVSIDSSGTTGRIYVRNMSTSSQTVGKASLIGIAWKMTYNTNTPYRSRVARSNSIKSTDISNIKLNFTTVKKTTNAYTATAGQTGTLTLSGTLTSGYSGPIGISTYNTGYKQSFLFNINLSSISLYYKNTASGTHTAQMYASTFQLT